MRGRSTKNTRHLRKTKKLTRRQKMRGGQTSEPCVIVDLRGGIGLGNQLFIYAAGIVAKNKTGLPICLLSNDVNPHSSKDYRNIFKHGIKVDNENMKERMEKSIKLHENIASDPHGVWSPMNFPTNKTRNVSLKGGFYQNYELIKSAIPIIRTELADEFKRLYPDFKENTFKDISPDTTSFMHVRKGDYGTKTLSADYYGRAIDIINKISKIKTLYILSDDVPYCKEQIDKGIWKPTAEVRWIDDQADELKTLYLMSMCKAGAIMSASSFSSWGVFLGADEIDDSTIIYPKIWFTGNSKKLSFPEQVGNKWMPI